ncbi:Hypothetical protein OINT_2000148 [Brucella intermedia LMG 3301]|nr:Hypothetical protein OINT_2000148 [Brucella intermedia LMG 3301]
MPYPNYRETDMKVVFVTTAVLALSVTGAMADCTYHSAQSSTKMEKPQTTASIQTTAPEQK